MNCQELFTIVQILSRNKPLNHYTCDANAAYLSNNMEFHELLPHETTGCGLARKASGSFSVAFQTSVISQKANLKDTCGCQVDC